MTSPGPSLAELLLGVEGLALLRLAFSDDMQARRDRIADIVRLVGDVDTDAALLAPAYAAEFDLAAGYQRWAKTYDRPLRLFPVEEPTLHALIAGLPPGTVLDAACGTGRYSAHLVESDHDVVGIDNSEAMLARARVKLPQATFRLGELTDLPLDDASVDAVVCALALVHLPDVAPAITEFARVLRPGGSLFISDVHPFLITLGWRAQVPAADGATGFMALHPHMASEYVQALTASGFLVRGCFEPALGPDSAVTVTSPHIPEATRAAWAGLPGVAIWDAAKA
ncbi:class I SAM-dependent methyltransferase [Microbaculum marinum]|uniref:Class I SAM-dependent methyltransferase n=1 Tax=Microbaculum marinum TaxID=1764581 RepID=A0AAW9RI86_9HYPH